MLARARLGDDPLLAEALGEQALADGVVDLVRAREGELLALEPDLRAAHLLGQPLRVVERRRAADVLLAHLRHLRLEGGVGLGLGVGDLELAVRLDERLGHVPPAELAKVRLHRRLLHLLELGRALVRVGLALELPLLARLGGGHGDRLDEGLDALRRRLPLLHRVERLADRRAHHHAVCELAHLGHLLARRDAEAHRQRQLGELADAVDEDGQLLRQLRARAGHARERDDVQEGGGHRGQLLDALVGRGRRDQRHVGEAALVRGLDEGHALLGRQVDHDEAVDAARDRVVHQLIEPVHEEGVVVAHENDGHGDARSPGRLG
mmetsp:Transcript_77059/g.186176  ORF Transcript_77059/g.186176 Transcript_77059/m.186176 type:complete len:322 (+) Transcript_77059:1068-2033(+)